MTGEEDATSEEEDRRLTEGLREVGVEVSSVYDLVNTTVSYPAAIPVLIEALPRVSDPALKEGIVRALAVKGARGVAAKPLVREFKRIADPLSPLKWAIGNTLSVVADDMTFEDLVAIVRDRRNGKAREMVVVALGNTKSPKAVDVLLELLADKEVAGYAVIALGKLRAKRSRPYLERFLRDPSPWIQAEARRALRKMDKPK